METKTTKKAININKPFYAISVLIGLVFLFLGKYSDVVIFFGIALVFDPFDTKTSFKDRPTYQKIWLIVHLIFVLGLFANEFFFKK